MADTVSSAAIAGSLESTGWTFLTPADGPSPDPLHVSGAAFADPATPSLLVEFSTLSPDWQTVLPARSPFDAPPSVAGGYMMAQSDVEPVVIAGALQHFT
ncbi:MAG TPA: hypothetical protein VMU81_23185 [Acetobacteraceae bacterium]|jgi:hypothetical protein|nr:hypothetical protein [Acetobacteraceae bacterium]